ncbi:MAG: SLBB domain-containing protein, partial [candidate division WOR-3 bacterium]
MLVRPWLRNAPDSRALAGRRVIGILCLLLPLAGRLLAQATSPGVSPAAPTSGLTGVEAPIISETYLLMPGDQLLVTVGGPVAYSYWSWISYEGKVMVQIPDDLTKPKTLQTVDVVPVSGLNMRLAQDTLTKIFARYFRNPTVTLTLTYLRSGVVYVTGEVQEPGMVYASPVDRVSQVLVKAGGLTPIGSRTNIKVIRAETIYTTVNLERFESYGDISANPFVQSGDRIYVPPVAGMVTVKGAVFGRGEYRLRTSALTTEKERVSEGLYELNPGERVLDLIKKAGGTTPWADLKAAYVTRRNPDTGSLVNISVDLDLLMIRGDSSVNIELQSSHVLVVPPINTLVYVEGEVTKPLSYLYTPNLRFSDYVGQAGGP